jgi:hypothetical protein
MFRKYCNHAMILRFESFDFHRDVPVAPPTALNTQEQTVRGDKLPPVRIKVSSEI